MTKRIVFAMTLLVAITAVALAIPMAIVVTQDQRAAFISRLESDALGAALSMSAEPIFEWQATADDVSNATGARVVAVKADRTLAADSARTELDRSFDRVEIDQALAGSLASDVRFSNTLGEELRYVAAPIVQNFTVTGAVRLSLSESIVADAVRTTRIWLAVFVVGVVTAAALVALLVARSLTGPLRKVADTARHLSSDLTLRADENGPEEVRDVAQSLNHTAERLEGILARTQRVAADASHHLRTPLTGVRLRLEAIEDLTTQDDVRTNAQAATAEVDRLSRRVDQVLALARSDARSENRLPVNVVDVVSERVVEAQEWDVRDGIAISDVTADDVLTVWVESPPGVIARIVDELMSNAVEYARSSVQVDVRSDNNVAIIRVADDGPGVPVGERDAVFERFTRGSASVPGGSGLGLALVREAARAGGGDATIVATDTGCTVEVRWPLAKSHTSAHA